MSKKINDQRSKLLKNLSESNDQITLPSNTVENQVLVEFTCPVCKDLMVAPRKIFGCSKDHFICSECLVHLVKCYYCPENYTEVEPSRRLKAESYLADYMSKLSEQELHEE